MVATFWWDKVGNEFEAANGDPYRAIMGVTGKLPPRRSPERAFGADTWRRAAPA